MSQFSNLPRTAEEYRVWWEAHTSIPFGTCWCGCNSRTPLSPYTNKNQLYFKGQPRRYCKGHAVKNKPNLNPPHRFNYVMDPVSGCWLWQGAKDEHGYGVVVRGGIQMHAHRYRYMEEYGYLSPALVLHHTCENKGCVRPSHVKPNTRADHVRLHQQNKHL